MRKRCCLKSIAFILPALLFIYLSFVMVQNTGFADEKSSDWFVNDSSMKISSGKTQGYARIVSTLLIVIALIIATVFVLKKKYGIKTNLVRGKKRIQIVEHIPLGVKKSIILIKVPGKHLLIGATNDRVGLISEIANEDVNGVDEIIGDDAGIDKENISNGEFLSLMKKSYFKHRNKQK